MGGRTRRSWRMRDCSPLLPTPAYKRSFAERERAALGAGFHLHLDLERVGQVAGDDAQQRAAARRRALALQGNHAFAATMAGELVRCRIIERPLRADSACAEIFRQGHPMGGRVPCTAARDVSPIVDRIGTGDAFAAGVLHGGLTSLSAQEALDFGVAAACLKHSLPGDFNLVGADDVRALLGENALDVKR